jgi:uncharacterized protein (UPF0332 family)
MIDEQTKSLSDYRLNKALALLSQAELLLNHNQFDGSINRSYYCIFNAVRAVLALIRVDSQTHQGVISCFDRYFVKTHIFEKELSKIIHSAFDTRQDTDYEDFYAPSYDDAREQYKNAKKLIQEIAKKHELFIQEKLPLPKV